MSVQQEETYAWMNEEYFTTVLVKYEGQDNIKLRKFDVNAGTNKGENFASAIFRVTLDYLLNDESKETTLIVKTSSASSVLSEMLEEMGTSDAEAHIYKSILNECEKLMPNLKIAPRLVHVDNNALVLEDLNKLDFKLANRKDRFNFTRAKVVVEKLAKFHALSAVIHNENPKTMDHHQSSVIASEEMTPIAFYFTVSMQETTETVRNTPELKHFVEALEKFDIVEREKKVFTRSDDDTFHVLNHGDLWINNIFFAFNEEGEPVDTILVDYQECFWGSPGLDLNHFLYASCNNDVHTNHINELIKIYHDHLTATLTWFNFPKIPSLANIYEELERKADQALIAVASIVPVLMLENSEHANPENFITDSEEAAIIRREVYGNPKFVEFLKFMLPILADKKIF